MELQAALAKTEKGIEEIETRKHKLDHRSRALLLVVNGKKTGEDLVQEFARFGGVPAMLEQLLRDGFIRAERPFPDVRRDVASCVYEALGPDSDVITQEVENCASLADLRRYVATRRSLFEGALGKARADRLWSKLELLLA